MVKNDIPNNKRISDVKCNMNTLYNPNSCQMAVNRCYYCKQVTSALYYKQWTLVTNFILLFELKNARSMHFQK